MSEVIDVTSKESGEVITIKAARYNPELHEKLSESSSPSPKTAPDSEKEPEPEKDTEEEEKEPESGEEAKKPGHDCCGSKGWRHLKGCPEDE